MVKQITTNEFNAEINASPVVLVDFFASWCGPCRMLSPILEEVSESVTVLKVNVDDEEELARKFNIMSIPCVICFKNGIEVQRLVGLRQKEDYLEIIK